MFRVCSKTDPAPRGEPPRASASSQDDGRQDRRRHDATAGKTDEQLSALLGRGSELNGRLNFEGTVRIDGVFSGEITTKDTLIVGEGARVSADINCRSVVVTGEVIGNITASESVELHRPARVRGDIATPSLLIEKGVIFDGGAKMERAVGGPNPVLLGRHEAGAEV